MIGCEIADFWLSGEGLPAFGLADVIDNTGFQAAINQIIQTPVIGFGGIAVFTAIILDQEGLGNLIITATSKRGDVTASIPGFNLTNHNPSFSSTVTSGTVLYRGINFQSEGMSIVLQCNSLSNAFSGVLRYTANISLNSISIYGKTVFFARPSKVQSS